MRLIAYCLQCGHRHKIDFNPLEHDRQLADWYAKHSGHVGVGYDFRERPQRWPWWRDALKRWGFRREEGGRMFGEYAGPQGLAPMQLAALIDNSDVKVSYGASRAVAITLASLAASSTLLAGRESTAIDNGASNKYLDDLLAGFYKAAASNNQAGSIRTAVFGDIDDTPTWPDVFDGTDSVETVTDQPTYDSICRIVSDIANDNTASQVWYWGPVAIAGFFGGVLPDQYGFFVSQSAHTSTNAWDSTEGSHGIKSTPIYATVI